MEDPEEEPRTRLEDIKYYTSLFLGTVAICALFAFLFLVPFVLDPAISTMFHQFVEKPVHCKVTNTNFTSCLDFSPLQRKDPLSPSEVLSLFVIFDLQHTTVT